VTLDEFDGDFQTLSRNRGAAFEALRKALTAPRFDAEPLERVRKQVLLAAKNNLEDPEMISGDAWMKTALGEDPYSRNSDGTLDSLVRITADDLRLLHHRIFNRATLQIAVVGDISASALATLLDHVFGGLPKGEEPPVLPKPKLVHGPLLKVIPRDIPQSVIMFGEEGLLRSDPDFVPAFVMNEILGGGGLGSRLSEAIREKRGLTYGVETSLLTLRRVGLHVGALNTRNEKAGEALALVHQEIRRMAVEGPTQQELDEAKTYLTGSYALRFVSNSAIADQLLGIQQESLGLDYVTTRNKLIASVTLEQVQGVARRLLHEDKLIVTIVGRPTGVQ
jgi:zinc protease